MERWEVGMLARSLAGHDRDRIYVVTAVDDACVYLVDGEIRTLDKPKKKKKKHVQIIREQYDIHGADDVRMKRILKEYRMRTTKMNEEA